jgi:hypothetical protein
MDNAEFRLNESVDWACILNRGFARLEMFGCRFNDNSSKYDAVIKNESQAVLVMDKTSCKHNKSTSLFNQAVMKITDSIFTGNFSAKNTGAIKNSGKLEVYGTKFLDNESERYGGAVSNLYDGIMDVCNSQFMNNRTIEFAGAVANIGKISIKDCRFKNNASQYGGAINNQGKMNIISCEFEDNESEYGGAIYNCKIMNVLASEFKANKSQEKSNSIANGLHKFHPLFDEEKTQLILQLNPYDYLFSHLIIKNTDFFNDYSIDDEVCTWSPRDLRLENCRYNNRELGMENTN